MGSAETLRADDPRAIDRAAEIIRAGGVVAIPTETFYGLAADVRNEAAVARIFEIKGRPASMQLPLVAASVDQVIAQLGPLDAKSRQAAETYWPGALSLIVGEGTGHAVRVPSHEFVRALCARTGVLLTATSANRTGEPAAETAQDVAAALGSLLDLIIDGARTPGGKPSTIVDLRSGEARVIREGALTYPVKR